MKERAAKPEVIEVKRNGAFARIRPTLKDGTQYFVLDYRVNGKRKLVWRSTLADAKTEANFALDKIGVGEAEALDLTSTDRHIYLRAKEAAASLPKPIDDICRDHAEAFQILGGKTSVIEACRDWIKRNANITEKITVRDAMNRMMVELEAQGVSPQERIDFKTAIRSFADYLDSNPATFNAEVQAITPDMVNVHLAGLDLAKRTKANRRDRIGKFNRWLVLKCLLPKGTDWMENVKKYSRVKEGEIEVFTPDEMRRLLAVAEEMTLFLVLAAFSGIRHLTIIRMDWSEIDLENEYVTKAGVKWPGCIKVPGRKGKNKTRYIIPVHENLKAWLLPLCKKSGKLFPQLAEYERPQFFTTKRLAEVAASAGIPWKHNALRHSYVSYRLAECNDIMLVARESNNSPSVIETNYDAVVMPSAAAEWFNLMPPEKAGK